LDLKGNELLVYALIHGFSQEAQGCFFGSLSYVCKACGCTHKTAINVLKDLVDKGLVRKREIMENNVKLCQYTALTGGSVKITPPVQNLHGGGVEITPGGSVKITPNNKTIDNKSITKCKGTHPPLILPFSSEKFIDTWAALCEEKNWKGKTQKALQLTLNKLGRYAEEFAIELMEKTIENGWKGVVFSDTDAKYQEWQSARQQKIDQAQPRTSQQSAQQMKGVQEMAARLAKMRELAQQQNEEP
jgi:hypothetical protein